MKVWVESKTTCLHSRREEGQWGDWSAQNDYDILNIHLNQPKEHDGFISDLEEIRFQSKGKIPSTVYALVVIYVSGDSFGSSSGNGHTQGIYGSLRDAEKVRKKILDESYNGKDKSVWTGYFERLEEVVIRKCKINRKKSK